MNAKRTSWLFVALFAIVVALIAGVELDPATSMWMYRDRNDVNRVFMVLASLGFLGTVAYSHPFYRSRNPEFTDVPPGTLSCVGGNNCTDLVSGTLNPSDVLAYGGLFSMEWGKWNPAIYYLGATQWAYHPSAARNPVDGTPIGAPPGFDELQLRVRDPQADRAAVRQVAADVARLLEHKGLQVTDVDVPEPGVHVHAAQMNSMLMTQGAFGVLALVVCSFLVVNLVQSMLADMVLDVDASALLIYRAAWLRDVKGQRNSREAALAKLHATDRAQQVIDKAVQIFGGLGVTVGVPVERLYREIRALRIYEGASEVQKVVIARNHLAESAK